jgi:hypothetical protein
MRRLSIDDAVATALEQNLDLQVQRINPQLRDATSRSSRPATRRPSPRRSTGRPTQPPSSLLSGNTSQLTTGRSTLNFGVRSRTPWYGGSYQFLSTTAERPRTTFHQLRPAADVEHQRHLHAAAAAQLQDRRHAPAAAGQPEEQGISETQLQQSIALTVRSVRNAFYDLMYAIGNLNVQRQSLELAQQSLKDNRARVEIGTMAPLDIVQAEAEVATREEAVILAEAAIERQQDVIRALVYNPQTPDFWTARIEPVDTPTFTPTTVDTDAAVKNALSQRTDLVVARKNSSRTTSTSATSTTSRCRTSMRRSTTARRPSAASACCAGRRRA